MADIKSLLISSLFLQLAWPQAAYAQVGSSQHGAFGEEIGDFGYTSVGHDVAVHGKVFVVDKNTLYVKGFNFKDNGADAFFWAGKEDVPSPEGEIVQYPFDSVEHKPQKLPALSNASFMLKLPGENTIRNIKSLAVWDQKKSESLGSVVFPKHLKVPEPKVLPEFSRLAHGLRSGNITILDAKTFLIPNLHYDGKGPDAYFMVGHGSEPDGNGIKVPNEFGKLDVLKAYKGETIKIQLPESLTVYNIDWLVMWCIQYKHNFGWVKIPKDLHVPPALGQNNIGVIKAEPAKPTSPLDNKVQGSKDNGACKTQHLTVTTVLLCLLAVLINLRKH